MIVNNVFLTVFNCTYQPPTKNVLSLTMPILAMHLMGNDVSGERYRTTMVLLFPFVLESKMLDLSVLILGHCLSLHTFPDT